MNPLLCMHACLHACVRLSHFLIKLYISFSYEDIFTKFVKHVYCCKNMSVKNYGTYFENHLYIVKFKILQLPVSDLHKM